MFEAADAKLWAQLLEVSEGGKKPVITAERLQNTLLLFREEAVECLKRFNRKDWGFYVVGRRGHPTRVNLRLETLHALRDEAQSVSTAPEEPAESGEAEVGERAGSSAVTIDHSYQLRPALSIKLALPADLNEKEAIRIARFVETLPM